MLLGLLISCAPEPGGGSTAAAGAEARAPETNAPVCAGPDKPIPTSPEFADAVRRSRGRSLPFGAGLENRRKDQGKAAPPAPASSVTPPPEVVERLDAYLAAVERSRERLSRLPAAQQARERAAMKAAIVGEGK
jgi:hypothetical protein